MIRGPELVLFSSGLELVASSGEASVSIKTENLFFEQLGNSA
jgi:hypothetical protein